MKRSSFLLGALGLAPQYPPGLFGLRFAAQLASAMLLVFGLFLLLLQPSWPVLIYAVLLLVFGASNIAVLKHIKTAPAEPRYERLLAHTCSALLPLAYLVGAAFSHTFVWSQFCAVLVPSALVALAVEQSLQWRRRKLQKH
jgi:hypothetical protein